MSDFNRSASIDWGLKIYVLLTFAFVFAPIAASFVFSFNVDRFPSLPLGGFSLTWYQQVAADPLVWEGLRNTVVVGVTVSILATALGFGAAYTDFRYRFLGKSLYLALALLPPTIPVVSSYSVSPVPVRWIDSGRVTYQLSSSTSNFVLVSASFNFPFSIRGRRQIVSGAGRRAGSAGIPSRNGPAILRAGDHGAGQAGCKPGRRDGPTGSGSGYSLRAGNV